MKKFWKSTWIVATTYIGTVVGAGFASGQEVMRFFSHHGLHGITGVLLSTLLFSLGGILILSIGRTLRATSYKEVLQYVCGRRLGRLLELLITFFLFGTLCVMLAGAGALLFQQLHLPLLAGILLTSAITVFTVLFGMKGIVSANSVVVPLLTIGCLVVGITSIYNGLFINQNSLGSGATPTFFFRPPWAVSALIYVAYNLSLSVGVLSPLGNQVKNRRPVLLGGALGGLLLGFLASIINLSLLANLNSVAHMEIPMLKLAENLGPMFQTLYALILWAEIFTTIIGNVYSVTTHLSDSFNLSYHRTLLILMGLALLFSQVGFSNLVGVLYPLFGYVSLIFLAGLFTKPFRSK